MARCRRSPAAAAAATAATSTSLLLLLACCGAANGEIFSALVHIESAFRAERDLAADIRHYVRREESRLTELARLADQLERHSASGGSRLDLEHHLSNPVSAYSTIRDLYQGAKQAERLVTEASKNSQDFYNVSVITSDFIPSEADLTSAAAALFRLQDTYEIPTHKIADVHFLGDDIGPEVPPLAVTDIIDIGKAAYNNQDYYHATRWLLEAAERLPPSDGGVADGGVTGLVRFELLDYLAYALYKQGNVKRALLITEQALQLQPDNKRLLANCNYYSKELSQLANWQGAEPPLQLSRPLVGYQTEESFAAYEKLCRGESIMRIRGQDRLSCRYTTGGGHPLLMYAPAKLEVLSHDPYVVFYHGILTDGETELIKNLSIPKLHRSGVFTSSGGGTADYRTSKSAWLADSAHPSIGRITRRITAVVGLRADTAEPLQVLNYGIGGHYEPHQDFVQDNHIHHQFTSEHGNRIATFINYLSDVHAGGATAFPLLGITVWPEKGGAAFWYNLFRDGTGDLRTLHAACPVLAGYKWVANKWFHEGSNEFTRPCFLKEDHL